MCFYTKLVFPPAYAEPCNLYQYLNLVTYVCVSLFVCLYIQIEKELNRFEKKSFLPKKVWTTKVTLAIILEVKTTTPSCRKPDKPSKTGFSGLALLYLEKLFFDFDENRQNGVKDMSTPKYEKELKEKEDIANTHSFSLHVSIKNRTRIVNQPQITFSIFCVLP